MADFPAGHSMDTEWFAVDRDGHVAHFESGESGAVPVEAYLGEDYFGPVEQLAAVPAGECALDPESRCAPELNAPGHCRPPREDLATDVLMFFDSRDPAVAELARGAAEERRATRGVAVLFHAMSPARHRELHEAGACRGCSWHFGDPEREVAPAEHGVFEYVHLSENVYAGPYGRERVPLRPVRLEELPPEVRAIAARARFTGLCFAETGHIQPAAHLPSQSWDGAWLDVEKKELRPCPGQEDVFNDSYGPKGHLRGDLEGLGITAAVAPPPPKRSFWSKLFGKR